MISIPCRCGATSKNFYSKIGPFYVDECCEAAGYDHLGNKVEGGPVRIASAQVTIVTELQPGETQDQAEVRVLEEILGEKVDQPATADDAVDIEVESEESESEEASEEDPIQDEEAAEQEDPRPEAEESKEVKLPKTRSGRGRKKAEDAQ